MPESIRFTSDARIVLTQPEIDLLDEILASGDWSGAHFDRTGGATVGARARA